MNVPAGFRVAAGSALRQGLWAGMIVALLACAAPQVLLLDHPSGIRVGVLSEQPAAPNGIAPEFSKFTALDMEASLRRITITHSTWISFSQTEPKPLFSPEQIRLIRKPLADALVKLGPNERAFVECKDQYKHYDVDMEIYPDGGELVYRFRALIRNRADVRPNEEPIDQGILVAQPGQTTTRSARVNFLRESIRKSDFDQATRLAQARERIERAYQEKTVDSEERAQLLQIAAGRQVPSDDAWQLFWGRWDLLHKAHQQELVDDAAYVERKPRLIQELRP